MRLSISSSKLLKLYPTPISPTNSVVESFLGEYRSKLVSGNRVVVDSKYLNPRPRFIVNGTTANLLLNNKNYNFPDPSPPAAESRNFLTLLFSFFSINIKMLQLLICVPNFLVLPFKAELQSPPCQSQMERPLLINPSTLQPFNAFNALQSQSKLVCLSEHISGGKGGKVSSKLLILGFLLSQCQSVLLNTSQVEKEAKLHQSC